MPDSPLDPQQWRAQLHREPGLADIARLAGVSNMTVSRVINGGTNVAAATRARVEDIMRAVDFAPNAAAQALRAGKARSIGFLSITSELVGALAKVLVRLEQCARDEGYAVTVATLDEINEVTIRQARRQFRQNGVEVVVVISPMIDSRPALELLARDFPCVGIWTPPGVMTPVPAPDNERGGLLATQHLIDLGHREIAHISGPKGWMETERRVRGWRTALDAAGLPARPPVEGDWGPASGYAAALEILADPSVTAIFVACDAMALGALEAARSLGRSVPGDLSVVGYDDIPEAQFYFPPLTTMAQHFYELGERAFHVAMQAIRVEETPVAQAELDPPLIVRGTTAPPRS
jgi:DNA-binding LacI/PurR family transcriptional regulator